MGDMEQPAVSNIPYSAILTTIGEFSLMKSLGSILNQSVAPKQILLIDDSLTQDIEVAGVEIIRTGGGRGPSFARNLGIENSSSRWVALCDADDPWLSTKIEMQINDIYEKSLDFSITGAILGNSLRPSLSLSCGQDPLELLYGRPHFLKSKAFLPTGSFFFNKDKVNYFDTNLSDRENLEFVHSAFVSGARIAQINSPGLVVNYDSRKSLSRFSVSQECNWHSRLRKIDTRFAKNFQIESIRNAFRSRILSNVTGVLKCFIQSRR